MTLASSSTGLTITNPLVLYRALLATKRIEPDPSQYRLALYLQKLYERLKDYEPAIEYGHRLRQIGRAVDRKSSNVSSPLTKAGDAAFGGPRKYGLWSSLLAQKEKRQELALTRVLTDHEAALALDSPKGLMLHGEVGTGKSMLIDLFADCLPNRKKRRWHFNTFMLEIFAKLEQLRRASLSRSPLTISGLPAEDDEYSLLWLARDMITTSPILFLDEFQLPDRASSKIMSNLMTSFFQLGGVLIATSNRMPEELAKAAGMDFSPPPPTLDSFRWRFGRGRMRSGSKSESLFGGQSEFAAFLDLLKARCEIWEMEGARDFRRRDAEATSSPSQGDALPVDDTNAALEGLQASPTVNLGFGYEQSVHNMPADIGDSSEDRRLNSTLPEYYLVKPTKPSSGTENTWLKIYNQTLNRGISEDPLCPASVQWTPSSMRVYGRTVPIHRQYEGVTIWTFPELCGSALGPADYITLASTYHTIVLTDVPLLTMLHKNEARRFITLLDALYEARCKLMITAAAGPDYLFFPDLNPFLSATSAPDGGEVLAGHVRMGEQQDATYAETFSDIYQDASAPFRPNIASYSDTGPDTTHARLAGILAPDALEDDPPNRIRRSHSKTDEAYSSFALGDDYEERIKLDRQAPNFTQTTAFIGEDEKFAYKRARSRLWEMCGHRWWARSGPDWHRPVPAEVRRWESSNSSVLRPAAPEAVNPGMEGLGSSAPLHEQEDEVLFKHGYAASPFRTSTEPPPKFSFVHAWGMMKWGKKAGAWGQGVEGLKDRQEKDKGDSS